MSTPAASAPYGGDPPTIENRKVPLRRANVAYRSREYLSDKKVIPSYIFRGDGHVIDLDAIVAGVVGLTEFSGIWAYSPCFGYFRAIVTSATTRSGCDRDMRGSESASKSW